jgi:ABC-type transport system substrate-binding protein
MIVNFDKNVEVLSGEAVRAKSFMAGSPWANDPAIGKLFPRYDVEKGKQLLKEVEKAAGKPIPELVYVSPNRDVYVKIANLHYAAYTAAGLKINLKMVDPNQWLRDRDSGNYDITLAGGGGPGMDPLYQARMFGSSKDVGLVERDGFNIPRYVNKEYDAIIRKAQSTEDRKARAKLYQSADKILMTDLPAVPYYHEVYFHGANKKVKGIIVTESGDPHLYTPAGQVWLDK